MSKNTVFQGSCGRYVRDSRGVAAIEFAMLALPIFLTIIGLIEVLLFFSAANVLEGATHNAARIIRTGQAQEGGSPVQMFEDRLCDQVNVLIPCDDIIYEVVAVPGNSFSDASTFQPQYDADGNLVSQGFDPGGVSDVVLVRVSYRYDFLTPLIGPLLGDVTGTNSRLLLSTVVLRNEPYDFE